MNICIKKLESWFDRHPKAREWAWFIALWCAGLLTVTAFAYPIKWIIKAI